MSRGAPAELGWTQRRLSGDLFARQRRSILPGASCWSGHQLLAAGGPYATLWAAWCSSPDKLAG